MRTDFDNTMMASFQTCQRRYYYRHHLGYDLKYPQVAPAFGQAIHKALDSWWELHDLDKAQAIFRLNFIEQPEVSDKHTIKVGEWILKNYALKYRDQPFKLLQTEKAFCFPHPNGNNIIGRIDKIIEWAGALWVVDHKTTSMLGPQYGKMVEPNLQFSLYVWAARQMRYKAIGVLVDAILVNKYLVPGCLTSGGKVSSYKPETPLARYDSYRSDSQIDEALRTAGLIQNDIRLAEEHDRWIPNYAACTHYGECPYRRVCVEDAELRPRVLEADYVINHWDPRKEDK